MSTVETIQTQIEQLAEKIDVPNGDLPIYERSDHSRRPHIEVTPDGALGRD